MIAFRRFASRGSVRYEVSSAHVQGRVTVERSEDLGIPGVFKSATINWSACGAVSVVDAERYQEVLKRAVYFGKRLDRATIELYRVTAQTEDDIRFTVYDSAPDAAFLSDLYQVAGCTILDGPTKVPYSEWKQTEVLK